MSKNILLFLFLSLFLQNSCQKKAYLFIEGGLDTEIKFYLSDSIEDTIKKSFNLSVFSVDKKISSTVWETIWLIKGPAITDMIIYGKLTKGMKQEIVPEKLIENVIYRASAAVSHSGYPGIVELSFSFNSEGKLIEGIDWGQ